MYSPGMSCSIPSCSTFCQHSSGGKLVESFDLLRVMHSCVVIMLKRIYCWYERLTRHAGKPLLLIS